MINEGILLVDKEDNFLNLPEWIKQNSNKIVITKPFSKEIRNEFNIRCYFRDKKRDKPYLPDNHIKFKIIGNPQEHTFLVVKK